MNQTHTFDYTLFTQDAELPEATRTLIAAAREALGKAYAPYSEFRVGAAARLRSGRIVVGSNQESEVFPAGICAERNLLFHHEATAPDDPIEELAVVSDPSPRVCTPCGICRQVLVDVERRQGSPIRVAMSGGGQVMTVDTAARLLPFAFEL